MKHMLLLALSLITMTSSFAQTIPELTSAEVRRIDAATGRITLKHEEIKSLDMPPMTMVFTAKDKAVLKGFEVGDKVQFSAAEENGKIMLLSIKK
jgi:Cu(I)/Ag(I) efflux system periplasmic protein CusF